MHPSAVQSELIASLAESRGISPSELETELLNNDEIDSLEGVELLITAETLFDVVVSDNEVTSETCSSFSETVKLVQSKLIAKASIKDQEND